MSLATPPDEPAAPRPGVDTAAFEAGVARAIRDGPTEARLGFFGPGSVTWRLTRESLVFLAAGRAALMQLAHPFVAAAIAEHSRTLDAPLARFRHTFRAVYAITFGDRDAALMAARQVRGIHDRITGVLPAACGRFPLGCAYAAHDPVALSWVHATLMDGLFAAYASAGVPVPRASQDAFIVEQRAFARLFGVPDALHPVSSDDLAARMASHIQSGEVCVGPQARAVARGLMAGVRLGPVRIAPAAVARITAALLPEPLAHGFEGVLPVHARARGAGEARTWGRRVLGLPARVRFVGPYHLAEARCAGRAPGVAAQATSWLLTGRRP